MADFTLTNTVKFPNTTEVEAHAVSDWPGGIVKTDAAPPGTAADTQTMTGSTLTFTDLVQSERYVAYAEVGGEHVYVAFVAGEDVSQAASLVHQAEIAPLLAAKRSLIVGGSRVTATSAPATDYYASKNAADQAISVVTVLSASQAAHKYLDVADYAAPDGYELWGRSRLALFIDSAPAITLTLGLYPATNPTGTFTKGTLVPGSQHSMAAPAADGIRVSEQEFSLEGLASGLYMPLYQVSANPAQTFTFEYELEWFWQAAA